MGSTEEPDRKRRHLNNNHSESPLVKRQPVTPSSEEKKVRFVILHLFISCFRSEERVHWNLSLSERKFC